MATQSLGVFGTAAAGLDLFGASEFAKQFGVHSRAVRLSVPLSLRWGSPSALSLAPYVAPYAEFGRTSWSRFACPDFSCGTIEIVPFNSHATGLATGLQLTAWRMSFQVGYRDALTHRREFDRFQIAGGVRWRF